MQLIQYISVDRLFVNPENPRIIKDDQFRILCKSIERNPDYFETRPILCNKDMVIFAGNTRFLASKEVGMKEVPCVIMDIPLARQKEIMLRDNRHNGEWNWDMLANHFSERDLIDVGFDRSDLNFLEEPKEVSQARCRRCVELHNQVTGHQSKTGHVIDAAFKEISQGSGTPHDHELSS